MKSDKFGSLVKDLYQNCLSKSAFSYVIAQSLIELIGINYIREEIDTRVININAGQVIKTIFSSISDYDIKECFYLINNMANKVKHGELNIEYNHSIIYSFIENFNYFVRFYYHDDEGLYLNPKAIFARNETNQDNNMRRKASTSDEAGIDLNNKVQSYMANINDIYYSVGAGMQDNGFVITNIKQQITATQYSHSIYAIIHNFLTRSKNAKKNRYLTDLENEKGIKINYKNVFRYQMLILCLIRYQYAEDNLIKINLNDGNSFEFEIALSNINHYLDLLSSLTNAHTEAIDFAFDPNGLTIMFGNQKNYDSKNVIQIVDNISDAQNEYQRVKYDIWLAPNIVYSVNEIKHEYILREFLHDFFGFDSFKPGQLYSLVSSLNCVDRAICVLPTGWGKSLIYYMNALLMPCPTIVIAPTEVLIKDQIRNLLELHNIDDAQYVRFNSNINEFKLSNKFIFLTPATLQRKDIILKIININVEYQVANIILDEVHTICNWSHDFRPDYLMLSHNLFTFLDNCRYLGFTATANYKVLSDVITQLKIMKNNIIAPISYDSNRYRFEFVRCNNEKDMFNEFLSIINQFSINKAQYDDKMIVFTKNTDQSKTLWEDLVNNNNYETACFDSEHTYSYLEFLTPAKNILIAESDMGIGLNLPKVKSTLHYGIPTSKAQFVQEIGRASRDWDDATSYTIFKGKKFLNDKENSLINLNIQIDEIISILQDEIHDTDIELTYSKVLGYIESNTMATGNIVNIYRKIKDSEHYYIANFNMEDAKKVQRYFYMLRMMGVVDNWYIKSFDNRIITFQIELTEKGDELDYIKEKTIFNLSTMGNYPQYLSEIRFQTDIESIIVILQKWFYNEFLYYHREQLINVFEFLDYYSSNFNTQEINKEIEKYFSISYLQIEENKYAINNMSMDEILQMGIPELSELSFIAEELLLKTYEAKLDLIIYLNQLGSNKKPQIGRLIRIMENLDVSDLLTFLSSIERIYKKIDLVEKISLFNTLLKYFQEEDLIDKIYSKNEEDYLYYGLMAKKVNLLMGGFKNV